jgi:hypothetical protein
LGAEEFHVAGIVLAEEAAIKLHGFGKPGNAPDSAFHWSM